MKDNNTNKFIMVTGDDNEKFILNTACIEYAYKKDDWNENKNENVTIIMQKNGLIWEVKETVEELYYILNNNKITSNNNNANNNVIKTSFLPHEPIEYQLEKEDTKIS